MRKKNKIGIIGGVGPQATSYLYSKIIELSQSKYGARDNCDYPSLLIEPLPVPDFISDKKNINLATQMLKESTKTLETAGVSKICIASNTIHILMQDLKSVTSLKFISIVDLVCDKCGILNIKKAGLIGTPTLINSGLYQKKFRNHGISLVTPNKSQLKVVEALIKGIIKGDVPSDLNYLYVEIINSLFEQGLDCIILGCTELPLALDYQVLGRRIINSDEILAEGIVDEYYANKAQDPGSKTQVNARNKNSKFKKQNSKSAWKI